MTAGAIATSGLLALPLWAGGTIVFDAVHCGLHAMLRSRWRLVRALAWPHAMHHRWLDGALRVHPEHRLANVFCHLLPEYVTQLAVSGALLAVLPAGPVAACAVLQTLAFAYVLSQGGLDVNHRPVALLDADRPLPVCPPAYHALHHVYPDAYFSAYSKLVDQVLGGGAWLAGKRYALAGGDTLFGRALGEALARAGAAELRTIAEPAEAARADLDVLVLCAPEAVAREAAFVEAFVAATRARQLPPEVWAAHGRPDPTARHYRRDVRVRHRTLVLLAGDAASRDADAARRAARIALFWIRRDARLVPTSLAVGALGALRRFRRVRPVAPGGVAPVRSRREALAV